MLRGAKAGPLRLSLALGAVALTASGAAACGDDDATTAAPAGGGTAVEVADFSFTPGDLTVGAGSTITWTNSGQEIHTVKGAGFFSKAMAAGDSYEHRFTKPGTYRYLCTLHPAQMRGIITVDGAS
jgi:plastocyanin